MLLCARVSRPDGGTVAEPVSVVHTDTLSISSATNGATIYYTSSSDGSTPANPDNTNPTFPTSPTFNTLAGSTGDYPKTVTIKAFATKSSTPNSAIVTKTFTVLRDVDVDDDGLIEIHNLDMLNNIRWNLEGTSYDDEEADRDNPGTADIVEGDTGSSAGAPTAEPDNCNDNNSGTTRTLCGYELTRNLDFDIQGDYASGSLNYTSNAWRPTTGVTPAVTITSDHSLATNPGFPGIGAATGETGGFAAIFEGNGYTISNLYSRNTSTQGRNMGLFRLIQRDAAIRNVGVTDVGIYGGSAGNDYVGALVGRAAVSVENTATTISASHSTGSVDGGAGNSDRVGGLAGSIRGRVIASYSTGDADGGDGNTDRVGGLVGYNEVHNYGELQQGSSSRWRRR